MEDELISFSTAKLAKEKGFIGSPGWGYTTNPFGKSSLFQGLAPYPSPTQAGLQKWLRTEKNLLVETSYLTGNWGYKIQWLDKEGSFSSYTKSTYEEALEEGLEVALNLLK